MKLRFSATCLVLLAGLVARPVLAEDDPDRWDVTDLYPSVEAALLEMPMVVFYRLSPVTYALGRPFVRVPHYAMVNLIAGREVAKELIQRDFSPEALAREALALLESPTLRERQSAELRSVRKALGAPGASERAAAWLTG